jgi:hypothetical protein
MRGTRRRIPGSGITAFFAPSGNHIISKTRKTSASGASTKKKAFKQQSILDMLKEATQAKKNSEAKDAEAARVAANLEQLELYDNGELFIQ